MALQEQIDNKSDFETFFEQAPQINQNTSKITGVICDYRIEENRKLPMRKSKCMDKIVNELAKRRTLDKKLNNNKIHPKTGTDFKLIVKLLQNLKG